MKLDFVVATMLSVAGAILAGTLPALAQGTACWSGENISVGVTSPSTSCDPPCPSGQTCTKFDVSTRIFCTANGNVACTYCIWLNIYHQTPTGIVTDSSGGIGSGTVNCGTQPILNSSDTYCSPPGTYVGALAAVYDMPCSLVTATTPWMDYDDIWMTVPDDL